MRSRDMNQSVKPDQSGSSLGAKADPAHHLTVYIAGKSVDLSFLLFDIHLR